MKTLILAAVGAALLLVSGVLMQTVRADKQNERLLRHVVLFKFKSTATPAQIAEVEQAFGQLPSKIKEIRSYEWGTDISPEQLSQGFTHCFLVTFASEADRDAYLPHPAHKEFVSLLKPVLEEALVVDYWTKN